ncbi:MAG: hypothetical protein ABIN01_07680 [Ferruginibacter sp.]
MKKIRKISLLLLLIGCVSMVNAQATERNTSPKSPKWVSDKGFWVIETNIKTPRHSIVHFYTNEKQHVYQEQVDNVVLNVKKRRTLMKLKRVLDKVMYEWQTNDVVEDQKQLIAVLGKK